MLVKATQVYIFERKRKGRIKEKKKSAYPQSTDTAGGEMDDRTVIKC